MVGTRVDDTFTVRTLPGEENVQNMLTPVSLKIALRNSGHPENSVTGSTYSLKLTIPSLNREMRIVLS